MESSNGRTTVSGTVYLGSSPGSTAMGNTTTNSIQLSQDVRFLLLENRIDGIENHMNWTIGGVTITITFLLALFALIQFVYQRKIEKESLKKLKDDLILEINEKVLEKEESLKLFIANDLRNTEKNLKTQINRMNGDLSRRYAIDCENADIPATAFIWWLDAIIRYAENGEEELQKISFKAAKENLEKIDTKFRVDTLLEESENINRKLVRLKELFPVESDLLEVIFKKKIEQTFS